MQTRTRHLLAAVALLLVAGAPCHAASGDDGRHRKDHDIARQALERGEIVPLDTVLAQVRQQVSGEIVGVELEGEQGKWSYEIKVIGPTGVMIKIKVDAATGVIMRTKEK